MLAGQVGTVYRVEHATGAWGPYGSPVIAYNLLSHKYSEGVLKGRVDPHRPAPWQLGQREDAAPSHLSVRYGFASVRQLRRWFGRRDRALMACHHFLIRVYRAKVVWVHRTQLTFDADEAQAIGEMSLMEV